MNIIEEKRRALGFHASCSDSPDMSGANAAALANAEISKEVLEFYKEVYAEGAPQRAETAALTKQVADRQLASSELNDKISQDYWDYQKGTFRPLEERIVKEATEYDTPERREAEAGRAVADVGIQADLAAQAQVRAQQRMGVNPNSGAATSMQNAMSLNTAAAKAGAAGNARRQVETIGTARMMDAASLGRGLAANQATSAGVALNAGNSAVANSAQQQAQAQSAASMMGAGYSTALSGNSSAGQLYGMAANGSKQDNSAIWGAVGTVAGAFVGGPAGAAAGGAIGNAVSDKTKKKDVKPVSDEQALEAVESTPVSSWTYKKGVGDEGAHVGPMAQHVNKSMGEQAAPDGKRIDLITMNGITMAGMAALSRKVEKLSKKLEGAAA